MSSRETVRIMGIDPGLASTGVGVIESAGRDRWRLVGSRHVITRDTRPMPERLAEIHGLVRGCIEEWRPTVVAIESVFFAKNVRSAMLMSHGRGAAILAAHMAGVALREYSPLEIKQSVVGKGRASKEQVKKMVEILLSLEVVPQSDHETDAIACALCHVFRARRELVGVESDGGGGVADAGALERLRKRRELLSARVSGRRRGRR